MVTLRWNHGNHITYAQGCPACNYSKLEDYVKKLLEDNSIEYEGQKRFEWLGRQSLDFYIPSANVAVECQGIQHFKPIGIFGGDKAFAKLKEYDEKKRILCEEHGIKLLYYSNLGIDYPYEVIENDKLLIEKIYDNSNQS